MAKSRFNTQATAPVEFEVRQGNTRVLVREGTFGPADKNDKTRRKLFNQILRAGAKAANEDPDFPADVIAVQVRLKEPMAYDPKLAPETEAANDPVVLTTPEEVQNLQQRFDELSKPALEAVTEKDRSFELEQFSLTRLFQAVFTRGADNSYELQALNPSDEGQKRPQIVRFVTDLLAFHHYMSTGGVKKVFRETVRPRADALEMVAKRSILSLGKRGLVLAPAPAKR